MADGERRESKRRRRRARRDHGRAGENARRKPDKEPRIKTSGSVVNVNDRGFERNSVSGDIVGDAGVSVLAMAPGRREARRGLGGANQEVGRDHVAGRFW